MSSPGNVVKVGIGVMVRNENGEMLMGRRGPEAKNERGKWNFPGGELDFGETLFECAKREAMEEYAVEVEPTRILKVIDHILEEEKQHWVNPIIEARLVKGEPKLMEPHKTDKIGWFPIDSLPGELTVNMKELFKEIKEGKIKI